MDILWLVGFALVLWALVWFFERTDGYMMFEALALLGGALSAGFWGFLAIFALLFFFRSVGAK